VTLDEGSLSGTTITDKHELEGRNLSLSGHCLKVCMRETRKGDDEGALMVKGERCQQLEIAPLRNSSGRMEWEGCGVGVGGRERKGKRGMSTFVWKLEVEADERSG